MKFVRKLGIVAASCALSFGIVGIAGPAHADMSWGIGSIHK